MASNDRHRRRLVAAAATVVLHALIAALLLALYLKYDSTAEPPKWPPVDSSELLFGGEMVSLGDFSQPDVDSAAPSEDNTSAEAVESAEAPAPPEPVRTTARESVAKASDAESRRAEEEERRRRAAEQISSRVFGSGSGHSGAPDGNTDAPGAASSGVAASGLGNRKALSLPKPPQGPLGRVTVAIKVDRGGSVVEARYLDGAGAAAASAAVRDNCVAAARRARFSAVSEGPALQTGTLTYTFK